MKIKRKRNIKDNTNMKYELKSEIEIW